MSTNIQRVLELVWEEPGLADREIRKRTGITPHQQVNQICNKLQARGEIHREKGTDGRLRNHPADETDAGRGTPRRLGSREPPRHENDQEPSSLPRFDPTSTLVVIACSSSKRSGGEAVGTSGIHEHLDPRLAEELQQARQRKAPEAGLDETRLMPALRRYSGTFYGVAAAALTEVARRGHLLILSGAYGVVDALEPIGHYDARLRPRDWPDGLLGRCLVDYADRHPITAVVAFLGASTSYAQVVRRAPWPPGAVDAYLVSARMDDGGGPMRRVPATLGEAVRDYIDGPLPTGWTSTAGLSLAIRLLAHG